MVPVPPEYINLLIPDLILLQIGKDKIISSWSFLQAGMCDEISVVIAPCADGSTKTQTLFQVKDGLSTDTPVGFTLKSADILDESAVWLRYLVKSEKTN